jgi:hypothetical protein
MKKGAAYAASFVLAPNPAYIPDWLDLLSTTN